ncbi:hypothetical protein J4H92_07825 [Leucobacter weissii]|uniref:Uncharacterized protein n=1 Tax=Leucobacter weissii TaxID=1983706 RepID=A0A939SBW4_9MICO|nr:hypothetical protein [Leucobacter weissii]MBO1901855.1 hypothetical protein [Leucobacter weissii]
MNPIDLIGIIGEMLSWITAIIGVPFLVVSLFLRARNRRRQTVGITIRDGVVLWRIDGRTYSRRLDPRDGRGGLENSADVGYVLPRTPQKLQFQQRSEAELVSTTVACMMLGIALVSFLVSLVPLFW